MYQSLPGETAADGLFYSLVLPFVGEWMLPVIPDARHNARFVTHGPPKGVFLETFRSYNLNSLGAHVFIDDGRWLCNTVATRNLAGVRFLDHVYVTAGRGWDDGARTSSRWRSNLEVAYLTGRTGDDWLRAGVGLRFERVARPSPTLAYIPSWC